MLALFLLTKETVMKKLLLCFALIFAGSSACYAQSGATIQYVPIQNVVPVVNYVPVVSSVVVTNWIPVQVVPIVPQYPIYIVPQFQRPCWFHRNVQNNVWAIPSPMIRYNY